MNNEISARDGTTGAPDFGYSVLANEYGFYCAPDDYGHREIVGLLRAGKVYEPDTLRFISRQIGTGDIISGGAFIGDFFPALHEALADGAEIHSFEPNPMSFRAAAETIRLNDLGNIRLLPVAVGERAEKLTMQVAGADGRKIAAAARIAPAGKVKKEHSIEVDVVTLDSIIAPERHVSILHLDVEGFEIAALRGAQRIIAEQRPLILLEATKPWKRKACADTLEDLAPGTGYRYSGTIERNAIYRPA